jgi:putative transposase
MTQLVEQHIISKNDPYYEVIDQAAFASKNLWNAANYVVRQSFIHEGIYLDNGKVFHQIKSQEAYQALPRKVSNQVLIQLHKAWVAFFEAMAEWREHPEKFVGRPQLPKYKHKTEGRNLLVYEKGAISKRALKRGMLSLTTLGELVKTLQKKETIVQARVVPRGTHYVIEVVYERKEEHTSVDLSLFAALDLGVSNLAAITSNKPGFVPVLVNGRVLKSINQGYNKQREHLQKQLARENRFTSHQLERITDKRNRRIKHQLHLASKAIIGLLVAEGIGTLIIGKNAFWKQEVEMGKRNNQAFVQIPHARFIEMLQYKAALVGITVILTEESYTSLASFLDRDPLPTYDPKRTEEPQFSGRRKGRWYHASGKRVIHSDVNGSYNIGRKVFSTAFDGREIEAPAVRPTRLAVK